MRHRTGIAALACAAGLGACGSAEIVSPEPDVPLLAVAGYVLIALDPAYGVVALVDDVGRVVATDGITGGKFGLSTPVEAGEIVCDGWAVRALVEDDFGPREARIELADSSGACIAPGSGSIQHWIEFDLPARTWDEVHPE